MDAISNCDVGVTNNDGIDITTREVLDNVDEVKLKDAFVRVYNNLFVLTDSVTSVPSTLLLSLSHILVLFPMESNLTQILNIPLGTASSIVFKISLAWLSNVLFITLSISMTSLKFPSFSSSSLLLLITLGSSYSLSVSTLSVGLTSTSSVLSLSR